MNKKLVGIGAIILAALFIFGCTQNPSSGVEQVKAEINSAWIDEGVDAGTTLDNASPPTSIADTWVDTGEIVIGDMI